MLYNMDVNSVPSDIEKVAVKYRKSYLKFLTEISGRELKVTEKKAANEAYKLFLYNCLICAVSCNNFAMSLDKNTYSKAPIRNGVLLKKKCSYTYTRRVVLFFESIGKISIDKGEVIEWKRVGKKFKPKDTRPTLITPKHAFKDELTDLEVSLESFKQINCLILRDSNKNDIKFSRGGFQKEKIQMLEDYNIRALRTEITKVSGDKYLLQLRKIYNEDFQTGGRLYDLAVQSMPKKERLKLLIDESPVALLDYKAFETSLAYTLCDCKMKGDPYIIEFEEYHPDVVRKVCKLIMTRIYNCEDRTTLSYLVNKHIHDNFKLDDLVEEGKIPEKRIPVGMFIDLLIQKHDAIEEYFFCGGENNLQYVGSQVMDYVIEKVMQNHDKLVIPVFDEVVCPVDMTASVLTYMEDAYTNILGSSENCKIEQE